MPTNCASGSCGSLGWPTMLGNNTIATNSTAAIAAEAQEGYMIPHVANNLVKMQLLKSGLSIT